MQTVISSLLGGEVLALGEEVSDGVYQANHDAGGSIVGAFKDAGDELQDFVWRARANGGRLPRDEVDAEVRKFNHLGASAIVVSTGGP